MVRIGEIELAAGDQIAIEGTTRQGDRRRGPADRARDRRRLRRRSSRWSDELRRLGVRANADTAEDAAKARSLGAEGIGLCRTEHMFFGEDRGELVRGMFVAAARWRRGEVRAVGRRTSRRRRSSRRRGRSSTLRSTTSASCSVQISRRSCIEMRGLPVTVRLLDPPLHEFLPLEHFEAEVRRLEAAADDRLTARPRGGRDRPRPAGGEPDAGHPRRSARLPLPADLRDAGSGRDRRRGRGGGRRRQPRTSRS